MKMNVSLAIHIDNCVIFIMIFIYVSGIDVVGKLFLVENDCFFGFVEHMPLIFPPLKPRNMTNLIFPPTPK